MSLSLGLARCVERRRVKYQRDTIRERGEDQGALDVQWKGSGGGSAEAAGRLPFATTIQ